MFGRISLEKVRRHMTRPFTKVSEVQSYLMTKLYEYYDWQMEHEDDLDVNSDFDYHEGLVDAVTMTLIKIGAKYPTYEQYVDRVDAMKWEKV